MKIKELHLLSDDIKETELFYNSVLDIQVESKNESSVSFILGTTRIVFSQTLTAANPIYHYAFDIPRNKFEEAMEWIQTRTTLIPVIEKDNFVSTFDLWNAKSFYFYDNNKNLLEFICRFDVENQTDNVFDSSSILYVSEIGIVSESASKMAQYITAEYNVAEYAKQAGTDSFTALGNDYGLLVLVNDKRNWFPTNDLAKPFATKIILDNDDNKEVELTI